MKNVLKLTALSAAIALAGCGGGGGFYGSSTTTGTTTTGTTTTGTTTTTATAPSSIAVSQSKATLSTGGDSLTLTFRVLDANGGVILGAPLTLSIANPTESGASLSTPSQVTTDPSTGLVTVVVSLSSNNLDYRINHNIVLTATSTQGGATVTQPLTIPVVGTKLTLTSTTTTLPAGGTANVSATAVDGAGQPMVGVTVNLLGSSGTVISSGLTGSNGITTFTVPAATVAAGSGGQLSLTASLVGSVTSLTQASTNSVVLIAPTTNQTLSFLGTTSTTVNINTSGTIAVQVEAATQAALSGQSVSFATSEGSLAATSVPITNISQNSSGVWVGTASTTISSASPGTASILVTFGTTSITGSLQFISTVPSSMTLQSGVSVLAPKGNTSIVAVVKDVNGAPVSNATVNFTIAQDASGGVLSSPQAITDSTGQASVTYTAGATATAANAVKITATATNGANTVSSQAVTLTVAGQSAFITVAQNNLIIDGATLSPAYPTFYLKDFADSVVDIAGNPITNQQVSLVVIPQEFKKGFWSYDPFLLNGQNVSKWTQHITAVCTSAQFQNIPNPVAFITATSASSGANATYTTDSAGAFQYQIRYGKNYATWVTINLNASTIVGTNQSVSSLSLAPLAFLATDLDSSGQISPPFITSPYGQDSSCSDLN